MSNPQYAGVDREAIWSALFAHLQTNIVGDYVTMGRNHVGPPSLSWDAQPALFLLQVRESRGARPTGTPNKVFLHGVIVLYFQVPAPGEQHVGQEIAVGATQLNALLTNLDNALRPDNFNTGKFTLGGLVDYCMIDGDVDMDTGIYTSQAAAVVPVKILVP